MTRFTPNGYQDYVPLFQPWASSVSGERWPSTTRTTCRAFTARITAPAHPTRARCATVNRLRGLRCNDQALQWGGFSGTRSRHPGGVNTLFGDGSVHFIKNSIGAMTWVQLGSINGGEVIGSDQY